MNPPQFGRHLLPLWHLDPAATHLNHGSFGACPKELLAVQSAIREEMERAPDQFFRKRVAPGGGRSIVRASAAKLAEFVGTSGPRVALVENATSAITAVLLTRNLQAGDEILFVDHVYNAVRLAIEHVSRKMGAIPRKVEIPIPINSDELVRRIVDGIGPRTRLAIIDHITSPTALLLPIERIVRELKHRGISVLVDGAHAVGQVPLDLDHLGADWYTSNAHKWLFAPKGCAFLYASESAAPDLIPLPVSHYNHFGFPECFDYVGTRDVTPWATLPAVIDFVERFGAEAIMEHNVALGRSVDRIMMGIGAEAVTSQECLAALRAYVLPQRRHAGADAHALMEALWEHHRIQVAVTPFKGRLILRLSPQIYTDEADFSRLADALVRDGWPGR
jgi:isopenicillin-N epimerase